MADVLVAGSAAFRGGAEAYANNIRDLRGTAIGEIHRAGGAA